MRKIIAVAPAYNEEKNIGCVVDSFKKKLDDIIVVDDGSDDRTAEIAKKRGAIVVRHPKNKGVGAAIKSGISKAISFGADIVVVVAGDGQTDVSELDNLLQPVLKEGVDIVIGSRFLGTTKTMPLFRKTFNFIGSVVYSLFLRTKITDFSSGYRVFTTSSLIKAGYDKILWDRYEYEPCLLIRLLKGGAKYREIPIKAVYHDSSTKMKLFKDWIQFIKPLFRN